METFVFSVIGIVALIAVAFLFSTLENIRDKKAENRLASIRKSLARKTDWLLSTKNEIQNSVFSRNSITNKLNSLPRNSDSTVG